MVVALVGVVVAGTAAWMYRSRPARSEAIVSTFHYTCKTGEADGILCLESTYQALTRAKGVQAAFKQLKLAYQQDPQVRSDCHVLAHVIGRTEADKVSDVDTAFAQGDNYCWSGYYHGVMESIVKRIGANNLAAQIPVICANVKQKKPYSFDHYNCVHGLGHGVMDVTNSQLFDSLKTCDRLTDDWERQSCYGGVFMENEMDEINLDHKTVFFKADDPMYPCTAVDEQYKNQCYLMQTSHALRVANENYAQVFGECGALETAYRNVCYQSLGRDVSGNTTSSVELTKQDCMLGQNREAQSNCIVGAVKDFISYYHSDQQAGALCISLDVTLRDLCQTTKQKYYATF